MEKKKVFIFGAGISGLAAADELSMTDDYDIYILEKNNVIGGLARSERCYSSNIPSEYSWRGYGPWYHNFFTIMKRIPIENSKISVFDCLSCPIAFIFLPDRQTLQFFFRDIIIWMYLIIRILWGGESIRERYSEINAVSFLKNKFSTIHFNQFEACIGPWIGIDPKRASLFHVVDFYIKGIFSVNRQNLGRWKVFNQPTNEAIFEPWKHHLENKGVKFIINKNLISLNSEHNRIVSANVSDIRKKQFDTYIFDHCILAISPYSLNDIIKNSNLQSFIKVSGLVSEPPHIQISFRIGFENRIQWPSQYKAFIFRDSSFNITMYSQDDMWSHNINLGENIQSLWSGTACVSYIKGKLYNKCMQELNSDEEFKNEILEQIFSDISFTSLFKIKDLKKEVIYFEKWSGYEFGKDKLKINEPKFVDSYITRKYEPSTFTFFENLFIAGAHTRTTTELWSMEGAAESGRAAADAITGLNTTLRRKSESIFTLFYQLFLFKKIKKSESV